MKASRTKTRASNNRGWELMVGTRVKTGGGGRVYDKFTLILNLPRGEDGALVLTWDSAEVEGEIDAPTLHG